MDRRKFLKGAGIGGAALAASQAPALAADDTPEVNWRIVSSFPKSIDTVFGGPVLLAERVKAATNGKFNIQVFASGEIVGGLGVLDAVQAGTVEGGHTISAYYVGKDPTFALSTGLPFGMNARQHTSWMMHGGGLELTREFFAKSNVINFPCGNTGTQMGGWLRKEINSVEDLKGLKFRIGGLTGKVLSRLGVVPQQIAASDIYTSLERGTIDAAEWVGPYDDEKLGLYKVAPNYYYPGFWEGGAQVDLVVNLDAWNKLPDAYKAAFQSAAYEAGTSILAKYDAVNPDALKSLVAKGAKLKGYPDDVMVAAFQMTQTVMGEIAAENADFAKIYKAYSAYREKEYLWWSVADARYDYFMVQAMQQK